MSNCPDNTMIVAEKTSILSTDYGMVTVLECEIGTGFENNGIEFRKANLLVTASLNQWLSEHHIPTLILYNWDPAVPYAEHL